MKRILTALVLLTGLFGAGGAVWAQDLKKSWEAYKSGDYAAVARDPALLERGRILELAATPADFGGLP